MPEENNELLQDDQQVTQDTPQDKEEQTVKPQENEVSTSAITKVMKDPIMGGRDVFDIHFGAGQLINGKTHDRFTAPHGDPVKVTAVPGDNVYATIDNLVKRVAALEQKKENGGN